MNGNAGRSTHQLDGLERSARIAIIGGSLTGPLAGVLLQQSGFANVNVYEARKAAATQGGGVMRLGGGALAVLTAAGIPEHEVIPFEPAPLITIDVVERAEIRRFEGPRRGRDSTWTLLHNAFAKRLAANTFHAGKRLANVSWEDCGPARLTFGDGDRATADLVIFADGRRSSGRGWLQPHRELRFAGSVAHRGQAESCPDWVRGFVIYNLDGAVLAVAPTPLSSGGVGLDWSLFLQTSEAEFRQLFGRPATALSLVRSSEIGADVRELVDREAQRLLPVDIAKLVRGTAARMAVPVVDIAEPSTMIHQIGTARAILLGDALAPVLVYTGRGANNGITQAAGLANALRQSPGDQQAALASWEQRTTQRVTDILRLGTQLTSDLARGRRDAWRTAVTPGE